MSEKVFPTLQGITWKRNKIPIWNTTIQTAYSGVEKRSSNWVYPRWKFALSYEYLNDDGTLLSDIQQIVGLFNQLRGSTDSFLYKDPTDYVATNELIGIGDGVELDFQLVRTYGGFIEPIRGVNKDTTVIKVDGVTISPTSYSISNTGLVSFLPLAVPTGDITASTEFYYRVRFTGDQLEFNNFMTNLWELQKCEFITLKGNE